MKNEINFLAKPLIIVSIIIVLFVVLLSFGSKQISALNSKIEASKKNQVILQKKITALESVEEVLSGDITFLDIVLPRKAAVLYGLSQIKNQAATFGIVITNLKTGNVVPEKDGVLKASISFEAEGEEQNIYKFLESFSRLLPLMNIDKINLNKNSGVVRASVSLVIYSAELPQKIPALTGEIEGLSNQDITLLRDLSTYGMPQFVEPAVSQESGQKTDPFN